MRYGVREIANVVFKSIDTIVKDGKIVIKKGQPVMYFDTLKTSSLESTTDTVYAQGGRGNPRLVAWEGNKTLTFTMEDALISPKSFSILSGADMIEANDGEDGKTKQSIFVHVTENLSIGEDNTITLSQEPADNENAPVYLVLLDNYGNIDVSVDPKKIKNPTKDINLSEALAGTKAPKVVTYEGEVGEDAKDEPNEDWAGRPVMVDYYVEKTSKVTEMTINPGKFGGSYYVEADTLWRDQGTGEDYAAQFIIPNCKVQSAFTFSMAADGDPSTFTFTLDAFPGYSKFDTAKAHKGLAFIQVIEDSPVR